MGTAVGRPLEISISEIQYSTEKVMVQHVFLKHHRSPWRCNQS